MKKLFDPFKWHPMAFDHHEEAQNSFDFSSSFLFLFAEPGCLTTERISSYISCLSEKPEIKITFLFPSEKDFLTDRIDHNTQKKYDLKEQSSKGRPLLIDARGRPQETSQFIGTLKKQLYDVELESETMIKKRAVNRFCDWYFESDRELFLFLLKDKK
jgi:hypothetical protein